MNAGVPWQSRHQHASAQVRRSFRLQWQRPLHGCDWFDFQWCLWPACTCPVAMSAPTRADEARSCQSAPALPVASTSNDNSKTFDQDQVLYAGIMQTKTYKHNVTPDINSFIYGPTLIFCSQYYRGLGDRDLRRRASASRKKLSPICSMTLFQLIILPI